MTAIVGILGTWLSIYPRGFAGIWTLGRIPLSRFDLVFGRLVGGGLLWIYAAQLADLARSRATFYALSAVWVVSGTVGCALLVRDVVGWARGVDTRRAVWRPVEGETREQAQARYGSAWRKYRRLRVEFPLSVPAWFAFFLLLGRGASLFGWSPDTAGVFALAWIPVMTALGWQWALWRCPRCGNAFKGKKPFFPRRCYYCGLPKWAESPDA